MKQEVPRSFQKVACRNSTVVMAHVISSSLSDWSVKMFSLQAKPSTVEILEGIDKVRLSLTDLSKVILNKVF